jgi:hypothetical protein
VTPATGGDNGPVVVRSATHMTPAQLARHIDDEAELVRVAALAELAQMLTAPIAAHVAAESPGATNS